MMQPDLYSVARALGGEVSGGEVKFPPPGHSPRDRSASLKFEPDAPDGFVVHCFANDDALSVKDYVKERLGLPSREKRNGSHAPRAKIVAEYVYKREDGTPYLKVGRTDPKGPFPQWHWTGSEWELGKPKGPKIPYRLPELLAAVHDTVFVCEGEKDADALAALGYVATTASEGAGKWTADLNTWFAGKTVYVLPDDDEQGRKHARQVAENLKGVAADVRVVPLPGLPNKGDVSDWIAAGNDTRTLVDLCRKAPRYGEEPIGFSAADLQRMTFPPVKYVVPGYIVEGLTLFAGRPKLGKSWMCLDMAIAVARGGGVLGDVKCTEGDVLYAALQDNQRRLQSRMSKLLGFQPWPPRLTFECTMPRLKEGGVEFIRRWIEKASHPRLVIIDTLAKVRTPKAHEESSYEADYAAVTELHSLAAEKGVAILLVHHVRKMDAEDPLDTVSGTTGLTGAVDSVLVLNRTSQGTTLYGRGRDIEEIEKAADFDKTYCRWTIQGDASEVRRSDERSTIIASLKDSTEALTPREIADLAGLSYASIRMMLTRMVKAGEIKREGRGRYSCPSKTPGDNGYTVTKTGESDDNL